MILDKTIKNNITRTAITFFMAIAGFSQFSISGLKPSDFFILFLFVILIVKGKIRVPLLCVAFLFSFVYAWVLGGLEDFKTLATNMILFVIIFSLKDYLKQATLKEIDLYLKYFNYSMFASNVLALIAFVLLPQYSELVSDLSSGGARFKGFFTQTNGYAFVLLVAFPIAVYFLNKRRSVFNIANVFVFSMAILLTQSRGVLLSLMIGFGFIYLIYLIRSKKIKKYIGVIIVSLTFMIGLFTFLPNYLQNNFGISLSRFNTEASYNNERNLNDISIESLEGDRLYLIEAALQTISEYPLGLGYQAHHTIIGEVTGVFLIPHNYFLSLILYYGLFLGLFWLGVIFVLLKKGVFGVFNLKITPDDGLFYFVIMLVSLALFYLTHSSDWSYMYILIAFYSALLSKNKNKRHESISYR